MKGKLIVIDGADGAGKATQLKLLHDKLKSDGMSVETIDFPRYTDNHFGKLLRECLDGKRGDFMKLDPRVASVLFAADRFESSRHIIEWIETGSVVLADRYVSANMLHQGAKLHDENERTEFIAWLDRMEHEVFALPRPDAIVYLDVPYSIRCRMLNQDNSRQSLDVAEVDESHQIDTERSAQTLVAAGNNWHAITCVSEDVLRDRDDIHKDIHAVVQKILV